ncbi:VOC family protein [Hyphococcus sp.]|uniref:VOC family protein n=1 Tax=Hyphococcus sp. TaxID=2038636 RepID=UPI0020813F12|nr:MAG: hypothetical protein DHS20C04_05430 [Marinicaulis sp.]
MRSFIVLASFTLLAACAGASDERASVEPATEGSAVPRTNNHIDYVEFAGGKDLAVVKKFYGDAFGWSFIDYGPDYVAFTSAGLEGGFNAVETPAVGSTLIILYADDLEASERNVVAAGGVVTERHEFPGGRRFHFRDPVGNVLGVWTMVAED